MFKISWLRAARQTRILPMALGQRMLLQNCSIAASSSLSAMSSEISVRFYSFSAPNLAKKKAKSNKTGATATTNNSSEEQYALNFSDDEDDHETQQADTELEQVNISKFVSQMQRSVDTYQRSLAQVRGPAPSASMLDHLMIEAYGEHVPLPQVAQTSLKGPSLLVISPFDPSICKPIEVAIHDANLSLNPSTENSSVHVPIPKVTRETRERRAKQVGEMAETTKRRIRRIRQRVMDKLKKSTGAGVSEDEVFAKQKQVQTDVDKCIDQISQLCRKKQGEVLGAT